MISIKGLHKFFNKGRQNEIHVINDITFEFPERGMVAIFGKSGCGKTTLLNVLGGLDGFREGSLTIEGQDIRENTDEIRNKYIGYIFQNYNLSKNESCYDNVANALRLCGVTDEAEIEDRVISALSNVGMEKYAKRTPDTLSGGQQQRIAIARAIVKNPRIILADEPTGNLDESNTVMVMDLLKAIAKEHLVILVTHEAKLVDYYCDTVIELCDGQIVSIRNNEAAQGFSAKNKNHIYLGELEKSELSDDRAVIEYYGDKPDTPIKLKIVNKSGKMYIQVCTNGVHTVDDTGEIKLVEGVFESRTDVKHNEKEIDMSHLDRPLGTTFGRLFSFVSSVKSGFKANFKMGKKNKLMRRCLALLSVLVVFMSASFGRSIGNLSDARNSYNNNVFYVFTNGADISEKLNAAVGRDDSGIDYVRLGVNYGGVGDEDIYFHVGSFETFSDYDADSAYRANAVFLSDSLASDKRLLAGKKTDLRGEEIILSSRVADELLKNSTLGYITEYSDLLGILSWSFSVGGRNLRVVGVVESDESAIYMTDLSIAEYVRRWGAHSSSAAASSAGMDIAKGETVLLALGEELSLYPSVGERVKIQGLELTVVDIIPCSDSYHSWIEANSLTKLGAEEYFGALLDSEGDVFDKNSNEYKEALAAISDERYFEYLDYYYAEIDAYIKDISLFGDIEAWMYLEKGISDAKYLYMPEEYYKSHEYKKLKGSYPSKSDYEKIKDTIPGTEEIVTLVDRYYDEYYSSSQFSVGSDTYVLNDADYITLSKQVGETHATAKFENVTCYSVIHSKDPELTERWILNEFGDREVDYYQFVYTPDMIFDNIMADVGTEILAQLFALIVFIAVMSVCMYFIVRSSLLNRVKEIGIYRAIGVSRKNMLFKFFIEASVLISMTVLIGYLLGSVFLLVIGNISPLVSELFYYPVWFAAVVLAVLVGVGILCGILPIALLLRKTPSEILAKYDI